MRRTMSVMYMSVDKPRGYELVAGIDLTVDCSVKTISNKDDLVVLVDDHPVPDQSMLAICVANDPAPLYGSSHGNNPLAAAHAVAAFDAIEWRSPLHSTYGTSPIGTERTRPCVPDAARRERMHRRVRTTERALARALTDALLVKAEGGP